MSFRAQVEEIEEIEKILNTTDDPVMRKSLFADLKKSILQEKPQSSKQIVFSLSNTMMGPTVLLLPLQFFEAGIVTALVLCVLICMVTFKTCDLTHLHTRLDELQFLTAIERKLGRKWMLAYFGTAVVLLIFELIYFFLTLSDIVYSAVCMNLNIKCPEETDSDWTEFSYPYIGLILLVGIGWSFYLTKLGKILELTSKGIVSVLFGAFFCVYLGVTSIMENKVSFETFGTKNSTDTLYLFSNHGIATLVGVLAMSFEGHVVSVPMLRKNQRQDKNSRDLAFTYVLVGILNVVSGFMGSLGLYWRENISQANTILSDKLYTNPGTLLYIFLVIGQVLAMFQIIAILPVLSFVARNQIMYLIFGKEKKPPKFATNLFNSCALGICVFLQVMNISPTTIMSMAGAFAGFVAIYLHPIAIHFKSLSIKKRRDTKKHELESALTFAESDFDLADFVENRRSGSYWFEYMIYGFILSIGVFIMAMEVLHVTGIME